MPRNCKPPRPNLEYFQDIYHSNFNETITFCNFKAKSFEVVLRPADNITSDCLFVNDNSTSGESFLSWLSWRASLVSLNQTKRIFQFSIPARFGTTKSSLGVVPFHEQTICLYARLKLTKDHIASVGAVLTGSVYVAGKRSVVWTGFGPACKCALVYHGFTAKNYEIGCTASS